MPETSRWVDTTDGSTLHVVEAGNADGRPLLFLHGFSQCSRSWAAQLDSELSQEFRLLAWDARGHGKSPDPGRGYGEGRQWADDVAAVIQQLQVDHPVLIGWSYGVFNVADYLSIHGDSAVAGINLVSGVSRFTVDSAPVDLGADFVGLVPQMLSTDPAVCIPAVDAFVRICVAGELSEDDFYRMFGWSIHVQPTVRAAMFSRTIDHGDTWRRYAKPALITHGTLDRICLEAVPKYHASAIADSEVSLYPGVGHSPFFEASDRFNAELASFARSLA